MPEAFPLLSMGSQHLHLCWGNYLAAESPTFSLPEGNLSRLKGQKRNHPHPQELSANDWEDSVYKHPTAKIPGRRKWQPTPVFLPGKSRGQRSLAGYSPWGLKESDLTEQLSTCFTDITSHQKRNTFSSLNQIYKLSCVSIRISIFFFSWKKFTFSYWKPITYFVQWRKTRNVHLHQSQWRSVS